MGRNGYGAVRHEGWGISDSKQPYAIGLKGGGLMALAGLWENWLDPSSKERVRSFAIGEPINDRWLGKRSFGRCQIVARL